jgi:hypothetical protein
MKTVLMIFLIFGTSIIMNAQNSKSGIEFQKKELMDYLKNEINQNLTDNYKFKTDTLTFDIKSLDKKSFQNHSKNNPFIKGNQLAEFRMPVVKGGEYSMKMPVLVPDSSVHYFIKEKRIDFVNPKERNSK